MKMIRRILHYLGFCYWGATKQTQFLHERTCKICDKRQYDSYAGWIELSDNHLKQQHERQSNADTTNAIRYSIL